jgi:hypothetical protein
MKIKKPPTTQNITGQNKVEGPALKDQQVQTEQVEQKSSDAFQTEGGGATKADLGNLPLETKAGGGNAALAFANARQSVQGDVQPAINPMIDPGPDVQPAINPMIDPGQGGPSAQKAVDAANDHLQTVHGRMTEELRTEDAISSFSLNDDGSIDVQLAPHSAFTEDNIRNAAKQILKDAGLDSAVLNLIKAPDIAINPIPDPGPSGPDIAINPIMDPGPDEL